MKHQPERVDQEVFGARHFGRNVGENQIIPAMQGHQAVTGSEVNAGLPFGGTDLVFDTVWRLDGGYAHD
ncbi:hypothetical protein D3C76_1665380 [compost metagenome]